MDKKLEKLLCILYCCYCSKLPTWIQGYVPKIFYVTEKAWNYYPYTVTEYNVSIHFKSENYEHLHFIKHNIKHDY